MIKLNLQNLKIRGCTLSAEQLTDICCISLKQLEVSCHRVPICYLLRLKQLQYLKISFTFIKNVELLEIVKGLPQLCNLIVQNGVYITQEFVEEAHGWMNLHRQLHPKLNIFLHRTSINWQEVYQSVNCDRLEIKELTES